MSACRDYEERLLDAALGVGSFEAEEHMAVCAVCSEALIKLAARRERMEASLHEMVQGAEPSAGFRARLLASVEARRTGRSTRLEWYGAMAGGVAVILIGLFPGPPGRHRETRSGLVPVASAAPALSQWRSPTEMLLRPAASAFLESGPRLGEFYVPLQPALAEPRKKEGKR